MKHIQIRLTDEEFNLFEKCRNGIPKQTYCKKKILCEPIDEPDFESNMALDDEEPDFYFHVHFKLSPKERDMIDKLKGDMTLQEFCRYAVLNKKIMNLDELKEVKYHLCKIGNNINQIARVANQIGVIEKADIDSMMEEFKKLTESIKEAEVKIKERLDCYATC